MIRTTQKIISHTTLLVIITFSLLLMPTRSIAKDSPCADSLKYLKNYPGVTGTIEN